MSPTKRPTAKRCNPQHKQRARSCKDIFHDEEGVTTTGMVLSLLITLALIFTGAQAYRIGSASAEVQDVADAAALAAESQVAEYMVVARFCDAVVLSLSLSSATVLGIGIAALCTPAAELSKTLIDTGKKLAEMRDSFSDKAVQTLDKLQKALPYYAAVCAAGVSSSNNGDSSGSRYIGIGLLVPKQGEVDTPRAYSKSDELIDDIDEKSDEIREEAEEADRASEKAQKAKERGFKADCGNYPERCMQERASSLIGLSGASNPSYASADTWSFSVALERAKSYYAARRFDTTPDGPSAEDQAKLRLMRRYCSYAYNLISREGYVNESADSFSANFPSLPSKTSEVKGTSLFTDEVYPITEEPINEDGDTLPIMHAWDGCPGATGETTMHGSLEYMDTANLATCPICNFTVSSMGKIASANTSIDTGFEKHYADCAEAAADYELERAKADEAKAKVKRRAGGLFDTLLKALEESANRRISVKPPGSYGAIAFVVNIGSTPAAARFASGFVPSDRSLGPRAAISAATLIDEGSDENKTVLNSMLDGLRENGNAAIGALGIALDAWSAALSAYGNGIEALVGGVETGLNSLPLAGPSGLGTWAAGKLREVVKSLGLEPAKLESLKPVLVNSAHVASKDQDGLGTRLIAVKQRVIAHPLVSTDLFSAVLTSAEEEALSQVDDLGDSIEIASIELGGDGGPSIPITIPIPSEARQLGIDALKSLFEQLRLQHAETAEVRAWE